jgi:hypothetical protein
MTRPQPADCLLFGCWGNTMESSPKQIVQQELNVNQAEQNLLLKRIDLMNSLINEIPSSDPHYTMMVTQVKMDQIELEELKVRAELLKNKLIENQ